MRKAPVGFIGQGFIGKNYADDFEERGYPVVRYALEPQYVDNKENIKTCGTVFIAVPTPTTVRGFDDTYVRSALSILGKGTVAVIKSTMSMGATEKLQEDFPHLVVMHSPEFLREQHAAHDARHPERNIVGITRNTKKHRDAATHVLALLPRAPYERVVSARTAELIKYAGNCFLMTKVVFMNLLYDLAAHEGVAWKELAEVVGADPRIGPSHMQPVHESGHGGGAKRGAGGHCFIKDFAAFANRYALTGDTPGLAVLEAIEAYNVGLLRLSRKDLDLLKGVYGAPLKAKKRVVRNRKKR